MLELNKKDYCKVHESVMSIPFNILMARSVVLGHSDGRIFVDSPDKPKSFYIVHSYGMTYLCGYAGNEIFNGDLFDYFTGKSHTRKRDEWLQAFPRDWDNVIGGLVNEGLAIRYSRLNFKFDADRFYERYNKADKYQYDVIPTPIDMLFEISGTVVPKDYWKSPEQFYQTAKAFTVIVEGKPVSTAFTSARHDDKLEIGIETNMDYQGKGFAYLACAKLIEYCLDNELEPIWSCRLENIGSVSLAKKLGFEETLRMPYYHIPILK